MKHKEKSKQLQTSNAIKITNEYDYSPSGYSTSIKSDFSRIKAQIISEIKDELFTQNSETIISNYKNILSLMQGDILNKCDKSKGTKLLHDILPKKLNCFLGYITERERSNDLLKMKTIETLSEYMTQLGDIIFNYFLTQQSDEDNSQEHYYERGKDAKSFNERFVPLINQLSKLTKGFRDDAKIINKLSNELLQKVHEKMDLCKTLSNDIFIQSAINNKLTTKTIQSKGICLNETFESLVSFQKEINNKMNSSEKNNLTFFNNAKDIFRKLKDLHNEYKGKNISNNPPLGNQYQSSNDTKFIRTKTPLGKLNMMNMSSKQQKRLMSRSTDHFSNIQQVYLSQINNSFDHCALNTSPVETEPHEIIVNLNNTTGCDNKRGGGFTLNLNPSNQRNRFLQTEVDNFNNTMTKSKVDKLHLKNETKNRSASKGKNKHNFNTSIDTLIKQTDSFNYTNATTNPNVPMKNKGSEYLAKKIIDFIQQMKELQEAIIKKDKNVVIKKKAFEMYKKEMVLLASDYNDKNTVSSFEKEESSDNDNSHLINQLKKDNEKLLVEIEIKKTEIVKLQESLVNANKLNETKKNSISMAKLKEFENIIKSMKSQTEVLKEDKKTQEGIIEELKKESKDLKGQIEYYSKNCNNKPSHELNGIISSLLGKFNSIYKMISTDSQSQHLLYIEKDINQEELSKCDMMYSEILKSISSLLIEQKTKQPQGSTPSTVTPIKTPTQPPSQSLIDENTKLKALFEECMSTIYASIKEYAPEMFDDDDDMSFNYASGLNMPVNLLDSNNSKQHQSAQNTIDRDTVKNAVEMFKKYNKHINDSLSKAINDFKASEKEQDKLRMRSDAYKQALDDALRNNPNEKEFSINYNNSTQTFTLQDLSIAPGENKKDTRHHKPNAHSPKENNKTDEMSIAMLTKENDKLKWQLKLVEEELKIKTEALSKTNNTKDNDNKPKEKAYNSTEQENDFKTLYLKAEKRIKELEEQYETLVKEVINGDPEDSNNLDEQLNHKQNLNNGTFDLMQMINSQNFSNDNHHLNKNFDSKMICLMEDQNGDENGELLLTQLNAIKAELKEEREEKSKLKAEIDMIKKKVNKSSSRQGGDTNDFGGTIKAALVKLIAEINMTQKIKEIICVICRIIGMIEDDIAKLFYVEKDKNKQHKLFA